MQITTAYTSSEKGSKIVARGFGKQLTMPCYYEASLNANQVMAAGLLLKKNGGTSAMFHPSNTLTAEVEPARSVFKFKKIL